MGRRVAAGSSSESAAPRAELRLVAAAAGPGAVRASPIRLRPGDSLEDAAVTILSSALAQFEANLPALRHSGDPESVHQMRVALRRLRAAIALLRPAVNGTALETAALRAKDIAGALGAARDWDVLRDMIEAGPRQAMGDEPSFYALLDAAEARRALAYRSLRGVIDAPSTARFAAELRAAITARDWTAATSAREPGSARAFAVRALTRLRKRVLRKSEGLAALTIPQRHAARIALKKARYGAEFFASLFARSGRARKFSRIYATLQDELGVFNDMELADRLLDEIDRAHGGGAMRACGFARGWFAQAAQGGVAHARRSEKRLLRLEPFWT